MEGTATVLCWCSLVSPWLVFHCISVIRLKSAGKPHTGLFQIPRIEIAFGGLESSEDTGIPSGFFYSSGGGTHTFVFPAVDLECCQFL